MKCTVGRCKLKFIWYTIKFFNINKLSLFYYNIIKTSICTNNYIKCILSIFYMIRKRVLWAKSLIVDYIQNIISTSKTRLVVLMKKIYNLKKPIVSTHYKHLHVISILVTYLNILLVHTILYCLYNFYYMLS